VPLASVMPMPRMRHTIQDMQAVQLLASSGVTMAAGAMLSLSFAVSPPLTLPRVTPVDASGNVTSQQHRASETAGAATDNFEHRWSATNDRPLIAVPRRDPLEGLIGGLLPLALTQDALQVTQLEPHNLAAEPQPEQQKSVMVARQEPPARPLDVCARHGLHRVHYTENRHRYWRCSGRR